MLIWSERRLVWAVQAGESRWSASVQASGGGWRCEQLVLGRAGKGLVARPTLGGEEICAFNEDNVSIPEKIRLRWQVKHPCDESNVITLR